METKIKTAKAMSLAHLADYNAEKVVFEKIMETANGAVIMIVMKQGMSLAQHAAPADVMIQCVEGKVKFTIDTDDVTLHTGDFMLLTEGMLHSVKALTDVKVLLTKIKP